MAAQRRRGTDKDQARANASRESHANPPAFPIVGVGASAGGLEAVSQLLQRLPTDANMAFVIVQHLAPAHDSLLAELLGHKSSLPVSEVTDRQVIEPNHAYVIPPDSDLRLETGRLRLRPRDHAQHPPMPIDGFFRSLARGLGAHAIGVVLSGAASDGTQGLQEIKAAGGITFAQDPATARYDGMPRSAIAAGCVDMVLSPRAISAELARLAGHPYLTDSGAVRERAGESSLFAGIFSALRRSFGVDFSGYKMATFRRRVERRMALNKLASVDDYTAYLAAHPAEVDSLFQDILIMVTDFFREPAAYAALRKQVLPRLVEDSPDGSPLRIWVPGCASGEEAYSIAIELVEHLRTNALNNPVKIFATDINERDVAHARWAVFAPSRLASVPPAHLQRYFSAVDDGYQVREEIRDLCVFARHDVTHDAPFSRIDFVSCRNLLIYLGPSLQERVLPMFHYALRPGGLLMLGASESVGSSKEFFDVVDAKHRLFVRREVPTRLPAEFAYPQRPMDPAALPVAPSWRAARAAGGGFDPLQVADSLVASRHTPPGVVIDARYRILQFRGDANAYLVHRPGEATLDVLAMASGGVESALRQAVAEAQASGASTARRHVALTVAGRPEHVDVVVEPIRGPADERFFLVLFIATAPQDAGEGEAGPESSGGRHEMLVLRSELEASRERLEQLVAEKNLVVEELRAANEEIQSSNEELQSINEELETAKEELQSTNEELRTVNEELEARNAQLSLANDDLTNLLSGLHLPIIMVDRDLCLRRVTPEAERLIAATSADMGRPLTDFRLRLEIPDFADVLREVIDNVTPVEREVLGDDGHWYSLRVRPYQTRLNRIEGAIATLVDVDELHRSLSRVADAMRFDDGLKRASEALRAPEKRRSLAQTLDAAAATEGADSAALMLRRDGRWQTAAGFGLRDPDVGVSFSDAEFPHGALAAAARTPVAISHVAEDQRVALEIAHRLGLRSVLVAPVFVADEVVGVLVFNWHTATVSLSQAQVDFADTIAVLCGLALEAAGGVEKLL